MCLAKKSDDDESVYVLGIAFCYHAGTNIWLRLFIRTTWTMARSVYLTVSKTYGTVRMSSQDGKTKSFNSRKELGILKAFRIPHFCIALSQFSEISVFQKFLRREPLLGDQCLKMLRFMALFHQNM